LSDKRSRLFKQGFAWWSFAERQDDRVDLLTNAAQIGFDGVDFLPVELWPEARELGLQLTIIDGHERIEVGFNDPANHGSLTEQVRRNIEVAVANRIPFLSVASGDRVGGRDDGLERCTEALAPLAEEAVAAGVVLLLEPLNSKIDHPGHECDTTTWGIDLIELVDSEGLRLLYDCYHAQVMEGDLIRTMGAHLPRIAHIHTAGCPGRNELGDDQEINWRGIANWLSQQEYSGYVTHELIPTGNPVESLRHAYTLFSSTAPGGNGK
jgi:hydroxypyruvate isomerase